MPTVQVVKFLHPGAEHNPSRAERTCGRMEWTLDHHARKFMRSNGRCLLNGKPVERDISFWGEWESPSTFTELQRGADDSKGLPRYLHKPQAERYTAEPGLKQNTDPYVFGNRFYYSCCQQHPNNVLVRLVPESLILFGSCLDGHFVLDTVFVVKKRLTCWKNHHCVPEEEINGTAREAILKPCCGPEDIELEKSLYSLYAGVMHSENKNTYFSYFPCKPVTKQGEVQRFQRPIISFEQGELARFNANGICWRDNAPRGVAYEEVDLAVAQDLWQAIKGVITNPTTLDLSLGVYAKEPALPDSAH
ncbi:MAG TPA: hypothetical protein PKM57_10320 [Kiritimatiellia bacterium]|nr:hypothetical protein [Kiritimatiellia bacterium]HPS09031.1 hypothetical protein [Kiritimatiellia bacterium]